MLATFEDVACPACMERCTVTHDGEKIVYAVCPNCGYELDESGGLVVTVRQMLEGAETGPCYNDVDLAAWTRYVVRLLREERRDVG